MRPLRAPRLLVRLGAFVSVNRHGALDGICLANVPRPEKMGACDGCDREVPASDLSTHMVGGAEGSFCGCCVRGGGEDVQ